MSDCLNLGLGERELDPAGAGQVCLDDYNKDRPRPRPRRLRQRVGAREAARGAPVQVSVDWSAVVSTHL